MTADNSSQDGGVNKRGETNHETPEGSKKVEVKVSLISLSGITTDTSLPTETWAGHGLAAYASFSHADCLGKEQNQVVQSQPIKVNLKEKEHSAKWTSAGDSEMHENEQVAVVSVPLTLTKKGATSNFQLTPWEPASISVDVGVMYNKEMIHLGIAKFAVSGHEVHALRLDLPVRSFSDIARDEQKKAWRKSSQKPENIEKDKRKKKRGLKLFKKSHSKQPPVEVPHFILAAKATLRVLVDTYSEPRKKQGQWTLPVVEETQSTFDDMDRYLPPSIVMKELALSKKQIEFLAAQVVERDNAIKNLEEDNVNSKTELGKLAAQVEAKEHEIQELAKNNDTASTLQQLKDLLLLNKKSLQLGNELGTEEVKITKIEAETSPVSRICAVLPILNTFFGQTCVCRSDDDTWSSRSSGSATLTDIPTNDTTLLTFSACDSK